MRSPTTPRRLLPEQLGQLLRAAVRQIEVRVPDAVLVGGTAATSHPDHPAGHDAERVLADARDRCDVVLDALARDRPLAAAGPPGPDLPARRWLGLIRSVPWEMQEVTLPGGSHMRVPTPAEALRIKGLLVVDRNEGRDYRDIAALATRYGFGHAAWTLAHIDRYYTDPLLPGTPVADQVVRHLAWPRPTASGSADGSERALSARWHRWPTVEAVCHILVRRVDEEDWT